MTAYAKSSGFGRRRHSIASLAPLIVAFLGILMAAIVVATSIWFSTTPYTGAAQGCTIQEKESQAEAAIAKRAPRVYTTCGAFEIKDVPFAGHFNAADTYGNLTVGNTYDLTAVGFRNGFFSWFPVITDAAEVAR